MAATAREVALKCLLAEEKQGAWSDGFLRNSIRQAGLDRRDAGLCTRITYGVIQNRMLLDWQLGQYCSVSVEKLEPGVRNSLRMGIYQIMLMDRIPVHAAVNEAVELGRRYSRNPRSPGLINAVLRAFERTGEEGWKQPRELSIRYSHPDWLVKEFARTLPKEEVEALLAANNAQTLTQAQVNSLKTDEETLLRELEQSGVAGHPHPWLEGCLELDDTGDLESLSSFQQGLFYIQDAAAKMAVLAAGPRPGMRVLDACAAPGGKSFAAAAMMKDRGEIVACDLHPHKMALIRKGAARLGISCLSEQVMDARSFESKWEKAFDLVIADVPCSGLGVIRKKPEIRYRDPEPLESLPAIQKDILSNLSRYVRQGGSLLYSTCTLLKRENEDAVEDFLSTHTEYSLEPFILPGPAGKTEGMVTLWPHRHGTDGFFIAKLRRKI